MIHPDDYTLADDLCQFIYDHSVSLDDDDCKEFMQKKGILDEVAPTILDQVTPPDYYVNCLIDYLEGSDAFVVWIYKDPKTGAKSIKCSRSKSTDIDIDSLCGHD